jgi:hypothetical protein
MWPLKQDYIKNTLDHIATAEETIGLALTVDHMWVFLSRTLEHC